jgi:hypothetical protein
LNCGIVTEKKKKNETFKLLTIRKTCIPAWRPGPRSAFLGTLSGSYSETAVVDN